MEPSATAETDAGATERRARSGSDTNPQWETVDQKTNTVYVANFNDGTVSVINGGRCNATVSAGCTRRPPTVITGAGTGFVTIDNHRHTLFAANSADDTLSAINTERCTGAHTAGCPNRAPARTGRH